VGKCGDGGLVGKSRSCVDLESGMEIGYVGY